MTPFNFAALRYLHDVSTHEFVNVGLVMWTPADGRIRFRVSEHYGRLSAFFADFEGPTFRQLARHLMSHVSAVTARLQNLDLFRNNPDSLSEVLEEALRRDSTCFQWSGVSSGICSSADVRFEELFAEFVLRNDQSTPRDRKNEEAIWVSVRRRLSDMGLAGRVMQEVTLFTPEYEHTFRTGWMNGRQQVLEPVSFDLIDPRQLVEKATHWAGRLLTLQKTNDFLMTAVVARPQREEASLAFDKSLAILRSAPCMRMVLTEDEVPDFLDSVRTEIEGH